MATKSNWKQINLFDCDKNKSNLKLKASSTRKLKKIAYQLMEASNETNSFT